MDPTLFVVSIVVCIIMIIFNVALLVCMILFIIHTRKSYAPQSSATSSPIGSGVRRDIMLVDASALDHRQHSAAAEFDAVLERRTQDLSKAFIEQQRLAQWVQELASKGELDPAKLATTAEQQAYALAIKMAEDKVELAASALSDIRQKLCAAQERLSRDVAANCILSTINDDNEAVTQLAAQESNAQKMLTEAQEALSALTKSLTAPAKG